MRRITFKKLYENRCKNGKPHYWKTQEIQNTGLAKEGQSLNISRVLASAEELELDVREFIAETFRNSAVTGWGKELLRSNIADESVHATQFRKAAIAYPVPRGEKITAKNIGQAWNEAPGHPLQ